MAISARKTTHALMMALVAAHNAKSATRAGSFFHYDITSKTPLVDSSVLPTTTPDIPALVAPVDLPTAVAAVNECLAVWNRHTIDTLAHKVARAAVVTPKATDLATAQTLANALKADMNAAYALTTLHPTADATNPVAAADAADLASTRTLVAAIQVSLSAHIVSANAAPLINVVPA